jgi:hypothetical protein
MAKKNRKKKVGYLFVPEGKREKCLLERFRALYPDNKEKVALTFLDPNGGNPCSIIANACTEKNKKNYTYVVLDNDRKLPDNCQSLKESWGCGDKNFTGKLPSEILEYNSKNKQPFLIVSQPLTIDGVILEVFGIKVTEFKTRILKDHIKTLTAQKDCKTDEKLFEYITRDMLENSDNQTIKEIEKISNF